MDRKKKAKKQPFPFENMPVTKVINRDRNSRFLLAGFCYTKEILGIIKEPAHDQPDQRHSRLSRSHAL